MSDVRSAAAMLGVAGALVLAGCAPATSSGTAPASAAPATVTVTASPTTGPSSNQPVITSFSVIPDVTCSGTTSSVPMAWSTRNAQTVGFEVDGAPVPAGAGYPVNGTGNIAVPCDGKEHEVALVAGGAGGRASVSRQVNTST